MKLASDVAVALAAYVGSFMVLYCITELLGVKGLGRTMAIGFILGVFGRPLLSWRL